MNNTNTQKTGKARGGLILGHRSLIKLLFKWFFLVHRRTGIRRLPETQPLLEPQSGAMGGCRNPFHEEEGGAAARCGCLFSRPKSPKGHLAVYVPDDEGDTCRVLVPVVYFNHPLFGELLKEAENEYGFDHDGGIKIPCPKSKLESVQMKIAAGRGRS